MGLLWLPYGQKEIFDQNFFEFFSSSKHIRIYQKCLIVIFEKEMIELWTLYKPIFGVRITIINYKVISRSILNFLGPQNTNFLTFPEKCDYFYYFPLWKRTFCNVWDMWPIEPKKVITSRIFGLKWLGIWPWVKIMKFSFSIFTLKN